MKLLLGVLISSIVSVCMALPTGYHDIKTYEIQEAGEMGLADCDIVSGSVTIINCPTTGNFTVYLSQNLYNQTLNESYNEVLGDVDSFKEDRFDERDVVRNVTMDNVNVTSIRKSYERANAKVKNSLIVIWVNETKSDAANLRWTHSVWRYFQSPEHGWIESEWLFNTEAESRVFYDQVDIFDDYAIGYKSIAADDAESNQYAIDKSNIFTVIFYKQYLEDTVPTNYEVPAYNQQYQDKNSGIGGYTFFDASGVSGQWELIAIIEYTGATYLHTITMVISPTSFTAQFALEPSQTFLTRSIQVQTIISPSQLVVLGCPTCNNNEGAIYFYDAKTLKLIYELEGEDRNHEAVGEFVEFRRNTGYSEQYWYTSQKGTKMNLNTILFFKPKDSTEWEYQVNEDLLQFESSDTILEPIKNHFIYKDDASTQMKTFVSCDYNYAYNSPDEDIYDPPKEREDDCVHSRDNDCDGEREHFLAYRNCTKCPDSKPFSYGFQDDECHACDEYAEGFLTNADQYFKFFYAEACEGGRKPVSCEELDVCEDYPEEEDFFSAEVAVPEGQSSAVKKMFNLVVMLAAITMTVSF